jgi:predicted aldo/keto reductase-like oxidoreductase
MQMAMETRTLGRTGIEVGVIGLGTEHLLADRKNINALLDLAVSGSVNYFDLFSDPSSGGIDEYIEAIGPAIRRHRERLVLCIHWGLSNEPFDQCHVGFDQALTRLGGDYAEIGMITMIDSETMWSGYAQKSIEQIQRYQRDGRVGYIGLSSHNVEIARMAVESGLIDVLMFPVNIYQHPGDPARAALLDTCATHQVGFVAMKPYLGGRLLKTEGRPTGITPVQCLHYVLSQPVSTIVPGARNISEMRDALGYLHASEEEKRFGSLHEDLKVWLRGQCVECKHCLPCPQEIDIPLVIGLLDYVEFYGGTPVFTQRNWDSYASFPAKASECTECEVCLERCPFDVDIIGKMHRAVEVFEAAV